MDEKTVKLAYASQILAAVIQVKGCSDLDDCVQTTILLVDKLNSKL